MRKINLDTTPKEANTANASEEKINHHQKSDSASPKADNLSGSPQPTVDENAATNNNGSSMKSKTSKLIALFSLLAIGAGVATGYGGYQLRSSGGTEPSPSSLQRIAKEGSVEAGDIFGVQDEKTFKDSAQGYLELGGLEGEGSHKLLRAGGDSQTVYLTSSITDLDQFVGMEVKIWGETFKGQKAGWLMDVGRIEVIEPEGQSPFGE